MSQNPQRSRLPIGIPALIGLIVLVLFLPWVLLTGKSERDSRRAIESYDPFSLPAFPIRFSKTMKFDPLGFLGQGMHAGFWQWTPNGMVLADGGRPYFAESADSISSIVGAGKRAITSLQGYQDRDGKRELRFRYRWTEVTPPARSLLSKPPDPNEEYDGKALLARTSGVWRVEKLETPDFDIPMKLLLDTTAGVQR